MYATPENISSLTELGTYMNVLTDSWFWIFALFASWIVLFIISKNISTTARAFAASSFTSAIIAMILWAMNYISWKTVTFAIFMAILGGVAVYSERQPY